MEPVYVIVRNVVLLLLRLLVRLRVIGVERIPRRGPVILAPNHISNFDPLCIAYLVDRAGRRPRFLAKASLWKNPLLRWVLQGCRQIPVQRGSGDRAPLEAAVAALARGECVVVYPEATITKDPGLLPMRGKTGVARLALAAGAPVIPVAVWGAQWYIAKYHRSSYRPRRLVMFNVGEPMYFTEPPDRRDDPALLHEVTDAVMAEVERLVRELHKLHPDGDAVPPLKGPAGG